MNRELIHPTMHYNLPLPASLPPPSLFNVNPPPYFPSVSLYSSLRLPPPFPSAPDRHLIYFNNFKIKMKPNSGWIYDICRTYIERWLDRWLDFLLSTFLDAKFCWSYILYSCWYTFLRISHNLDVSLCFILIFLKVSHEQNRVLFSSHPLNIDFYHHSFPYQDHP